MATHPGATRRSSREFPHGGDEPEGLSVLLRLPAQFLDPSAPLAPCVALAITFALLDGVVMFGYALLGARAVRLLKRAGALWLERTCGAMLLALAGSLALYRRHAA